MTVRIHKMYFYKVKKAFDCWEENAKEF